MKTNNQADKKTVKHTTMNYPMDSHKAFCKRCVKYNGGVCPITGTAKVSSRCDI